jgi:hypothetical protein
MTNYFDRHFSFPQIELDVHIRGSDLEGYSIIPPIPGKEDVAYNTLSEAKRAIAVELEKRYSEGMKVDNDNAQGFAEILGKRGSAEFHDLTTWMESLNEGDLHF